MKKNISKIIVALVLSVAVLFTFTAVAFAEEPSPVASNEIATTDAPTAEATNDAAATAVAATDAPAATEAAEAAEELTGFAKFISENSWLVWVVYIGIFVLIGYFLIYRPNKKRKKEEEELKNGLALGDQVTTIGGVFGTVVNIKDDVVTIESSIDRTLVEFKNWAIREIKKPETDKPADEPRADETPKKKKWFGKN